MNLHNRPKDGAPEAKLEFRDGDFKVLRPGAFVRCATTGASIAIDELKYWSVDRQEAYASPQAVLQRLCVDINL